MLVNTPGAITLESGTGMCRGHRARNSARIRESILAMILVASRYENQFLSLNYVVNTTVTQNFDSRKSKRKSTPAGS